MQKIKPIDLHPVLNRSKFKSILRDLWLGSAPKVIKSEPITGNYTHLRTKKEVHKRINAIIRKSERIKIGVMGNLIARMDAEDYRTEWYNVECVYKTNSYENARSFEVGLIKKYKKRNPKIVKNVSEAKAGRLTTYTGEYFIYVVFNEK